LWFWEINKRLLFPMYYTSIQFLFLWKSITTELFRRIRLNFLWFCEKQYKFNFFHVKDFNFCGFAEKTKFVFFPCITLQFDFCVYVKINNDGIFSVYYTSFFVVLWKIVQFIFFWWFVLIFCDTVKTKKYFLFPCIITFQFDFFFVKIYKNIFISRY
jgi:hypothetical protein